MDGGNPGERALDQSVHRPQQHRKLPEAACELWLYFARVRVCECRVSAVLTLET